MRGIIILLALVGAGYYYYSTLPLSADHLHGKWYIDYQDDIPLYGETMVFHEDGTATLESNRLCTYTYDDETKVALSCAYQSGKTEQIELHFSKEKEKLVTLSGDVYTRR